VGVSCRVIFNMSGCKQAECLDSEESNSAMREILNELERRLDRKEMQSADAVNVLKVFVLEIGRRHIGTQRLNSEAARSRRPLQRIVSVRSYEFYCASTSPKNSMMSRSKTVTHSSSCYARHPSGTTSDQVSLPKRTAILSAQRPADKLRAPQAAGSFIGLLGVMKVIIPQKRPQEAR
jgi:hypothetical protein